MELRWRNDVRSLAVKDQGISERARSDEGRLINGLKCSYGYVDHDQTDNHLQIVPEINKEEDKSKEVLLVAVPDEHSETGDHQQHTTDYYSDRSDNRCYLRNKPEKSKRRRIHIFSGRESEGFTGEVPSVTPQGSKRRRRRDEMSNKMRTLQQLVPNCYKTDKVSVLDKTIEYMKELQLQLQVMSVMGMNHCFPPATTDSGMNNHLLAAMAVAHGQNLANQTASNWPLPHSSNQPLFLTTSSLASCPQLINVFAAWFLF